jgi:hypothetical protein
VVSLDEFPVMPGRGPNPLAELGGFYADYSQYPDGADRNAIYF